MAKEKTLLKTLETVDVCLAFAQSAAFSVSKGLISLGQQELRPL